MNFEILQKLAKSDQAQVLYNRAKEIGSIRLFKNDTDFTKIQNYYLYFLQMYSTLYQDLASGEEYLNEDIINDPIRTEAYLLLKREKRDKKEIKNQNKNTVNSALNNGSIIFRRKK